VRRAAAAALVSAAAAGCAGGPTVQQNEALNVGGIEYRVVRAHVAGDAFPTPVTMMLRATNVSDGPREIGRDDDALFVFVLLTEGIRAETTGDPEGRVLQPDETIAFTLTAVAASAADLRLQLLTAHRFRPDNLGQIELTDL
jgi:hypothetical protein